MKYPYLVASLPTLAIDRLPTLTVDEFMFKVRGLIDDADYAELESLLAGRLEACRSDFAADWAHFEGQLRREIAAVRSRTLGIDPRTVLAHASTGHDAEVNRAMAQAFAKSNPRERELQLDQDRWAKLDELARADPFGPPAVFAFVLQQRIAHRWTALNDELGAERLEAHLHDLRQAGPTTTGGEA